MGLSRYVINFDDTEPHLREAIRSSTLKGDIEVDLSQVNAWLNTAPIENTIMEHDTLYKIITNNFDSIGNTAKLITEEIINKDEPPGKIYDEIESSLDRIIQVNEEIKQRLQELLNDSGIIEPGAQKIQGYYDYFPSLKGNYAITHAVDKDILLTGITYSQIGWKLEDTFSILVDGDEIFKDLGTKEIAEKKAFSEEMKLYANTAIQFVLHNNSGNSRQIWVDFEYIELSIATVKDVKVQFSGNPIFPETSTRPLTRFWDSSNEFKPMSEILLEGDYPNFAQALPISSALTIDGILINVGTRLQCWEGPNFKGNKLLDIVGPVLINSAHMQTESVTTDFNNAMATSQYNDILTENKIYWIDFYNIYNGSFKISEG